MDGVEHEFVSPGTGQKGEPEDRAEYPDEHDTVPDFNIAFHKPL